MLTDPMLAYSMPTDDLLAQVRSVVGDALQLGVRAEELLPATPLLGYLPELDSMAVVTVIAALEICFNMQVADDDDLSEAFESLGNLTKYIQEKIALPD